MQQHPWANKTPEERAAIARKGKETYRRRREEEMAKEEEAKKRAFELRYKIDELESRLATAETMKLASTVAMTLTGKTLLREKEIVDAAVPYVKATGIYFLIHLKKVVYVGQSLNVFSRMNDHAKSKSFDSFAYIPCSSLLLDKLESLYIHVLRPPLNGEIGGRKIAPLSLDEVLY